MKYNIMQLYIEIVKKQLNICMKLILERKYNRQLVNQYIQKYIDIRYNNFTDDNDNETIRTKILNGLEQVKVKIDEDEQLREKNKYTYDFFYYMLYFDGVIICKNYEEKIEQIIELKAKTQKKTNETLKEELYKTLLYFDKQKQQLLNKFDSEDFNIKLTNYKNAINVYKVSLEYNIKFPMLYSKQGIEKAFRTGTINEDRLFVEYYMTTSLIVKDIIKQKMKKQYIVDFADTLLNKNKKLNSLLKILDSPAIQEKINLKIRYKNFFENKEKIYDLMRKGFKIAIVLDETFEVNFKNMQNLNMFNYVIVSKKLKRYDEIIQDKVMLDNIIEI